MAQVAGVSGGVVGSDLILVVLNGLDPEQGGPSNTPSSIELELGGGICGTVPATTMGERAAEDESGRGAEDEEMLQTAPELEAAQKQLAAPEAEAQPSLVEEAEIPKEKSTVFDTQDAWELPSTADKVSRTIGKCIDLSARLVLGHISGPIVGHEGLELFLKSHIQQYYSELQSLARGFFTLKFLDLDGVKSCLQTRTLNWGA